ncbi:MAG: zinc-dependent metalloprotease [Saprospiraceae bacterium]|nr:zinc-dependent metalloprotease [Saprospiraceae bacterium]
MNQKLLLIILLFIGFEFPMLLQAQIKKTNLKKETTIDSVKVAKDTTKKVSLQEKVKSSQKITGLFTLFQDTANGSIQMYITKAQLNKEYIYQSFSLGGPAELFLNQNMIRETWVFTVRKVFDRIEWIRTNTNFYFDPNNPISKAANADVSDAIFYSEKVMAEDSLGFLINGDNLFLSEKLDPIRPFLPPTLPPGVVFNLGSLNKDKSRYIKLRSFPQNTDVVVNLAYENAAPINFGGRDITDARYVQVKMQHSFIEMPVNDYKPRMDDPRVGFFTQEVNNMTTTEIPGYRDYIQRWHLKKKNPKEALSEPVEPIVWWVENTTPLELRQFILEAGNKWNVAFEKAGFKNAVVMKMMSDTASWDPADIRYNVIRWVSSDLGYAIGPSFVNPRTGQILGSDITIDYGFMRAFTRESDLFEATGHQHPVNHLNPKNCSLGMGMRMQHSAGQAYLECMDATEKEFKELQKQYITELVLHEMGHTMGLMHNMKSSHMLSPEELLNKEITGKYGVTGSVMDYSVINLSPDPTKKVDFYTSITGPYDAWAIEFGYTQFPESEEKEGLAKILSRSTDPKLIFGNDADITFTGSGIDPRVMVWDMSNDMVSYAEGRFKLVNKLMPTLKARFIKSDKTYESLVEKYYSLLYQRYGMANSVSKYIGGIYIDRSLPGQNSGNQPYTPVPASYQKKAMNILNNYVFSPNAFEADAQLFSYLQSQRRGFNFFGGTEDPKLDGHILGLQQSTIDYLLNATTLRRVNNSSLYGNTYSVVEILEDLTKGIFDGDQAGIVNIYRRNIQTKFVQKLGSIVGNSLNTYDQSSNAALYNCLLSIQTKVKKMKATDAQTKAHKSYLIYLMEKALDTSKK